MDELTDESEGRSRDVYPDFWPSFASLPTQLIKQDPPEVQPSPHGSLQRLIYYDRPFLRSSYSITPELPNCIEFRILFSVSYVTGRFSKQKPCFILFIKPTRLSLIVLQSDSFQCTSFFSEHLLSFLVVTFEREFLQQSQIGNFLQHIS